jgi:UDP-N-acetylglucosamine 2-epimerase (non-hydrolysing)
VDNPKVFKEILSALDEISSTIPIIFPAHPRTQKRIQKFKFKVNNKDQIIITNPISYFDFLSLQMNAKIVLTDSGGIQEETTYFKIPCLTLRENTERPITIHEGTNQLVHLNKQSIVDAFSNAMNVKIKNGKIPKYWDDQVSKRIIQTLIKEL